MIGQFTGINLPNGGNISSTGGSLTFVQFTNQTTTASGFDLDWQCFLKPSDDISVISVLPIKSMRQNTPQFSNSTIVSAIVKNTGTVAQSNIPLSYRVNGGTTVNMISSGLILPNDIDTLSFNTPIANNIGTYNIKVFSTLALDTLRFNDTAAISFKVVENNPVTLPFNEGFESMLDDSSYKNFFSLNGAAKFDFDTDDSTSLARFRSAAFPGIYRTGSRAITLDRNNSQSPFNPKVTNLLTLTVNLTNYQPYHKIYFDFGYMDHGDEQDPNDAVWVRGNMNNSWINVYDLWANRSTGTYKFVKGLRLDSILAANGQSISSSTQIRWGQMDNGEQLDLLTNDGMTFDDISIYSTNVGIQSNINTPQINIYPNPAKNEVNIYGLNIPTQIIFMDATGKTILVTEANKNTTVNTSQLAKGIYLLNISNAEMNLMKKLIIE